MRFNIYVSHYQRVNLDFLLWFIFLFSMIKPQDSQPHCLRCWNSELGAPNTAAEIPWQRMGHGGGHIPMYVHINDIWSFLHTGIWYMFVTHINHQSSILNHQSSINIIIIIIIIIRICVCICICVCMCICIYIYLQLKNFRAATTTESNWGVKDTTVGSICLKI